MWAETCATLHCHALGLAHGGTFAYTILFAQTFAMTGWPTMRGALRRASRAYQVAKGTPAADTASRQRAMSGLRLQLQAPSVLTAKKINQLADILTDHPEWSDLRKSKNP